jgi:tRNA pseudouridine55 synthase
MDVEKEYAVVCRLGLSTDTQDITGKVLSSCPVPASAFERVAEVVSSFVGTILQTPPMYSAVKVGGTALYKLARKGVDIPRASRPVTIREIRIERIEGNDLFLNIVCHKGTYVRTLCADIGDRLGVGGCAASLRRIRSGRFSTANAVPLDQFIEQVMKGENLEKVIYKETCHV